MNVLLILFAVLAASGSRKPAPVQPAIPKLPDDTSTAELAATLCAIDKLELRNRAAAAAKASVRAMRTAAQASLKKKRERFPCNDADRLAWVIDNALAGMTSQPDYREEADYHVTTPDGQSRRPWNVVPHRHTITSRTDESGQRLVMSDVEATQLLDDCEIYLRNLLSYFARRNCPGVDAGGDPG